MLYEDMYHSFGNKRDEKPQFLFLFYCCCCYCCDGIMVMASGVEWSMLGWMVSYCAPFLLSGGEVGG